MFTLARSLSRWLVSLVLRILSRPPPPKRLRKKHFVDYGQKCRYLCVIDFECTCDEHNKYAHEIIEFPIVVIDLVDRVEIARFRSFVKPTEHPNLSPFCRRLTGIEQSDVDAAPPLSVVLGKADDFLESLQHDFAIGADAPDLRRFLAPECARKRIALEPHWTRWVDVSKHLRRMYPASRRAPLAVKLNFLKLTFEGNAHCGIDDAFNIARMALELRKRGSSLAVNDGLGSPTLKKKNWNNRRRRR